MTSDYFALENHKGEILQLLDIVNLPNTIDKLISLALDPFVYRMQWIAENYCQISEFWWGTTCYKFYRIPEDKLREYNLRLFNYHSNKSKLNLRLPFVASSSPFHFNKN